VNFTAWNLCGGHEVENSNVQVPYGLEITPGHGTTSRSVVQWCWRWTLLDLHSVVLMSAGFSETRIPSYWRGGIRCDSKGAFYLRHN